MENKELEFSVIICCYNPDIEKLKKTIISIVNQKDVSFEIIISDDGSKQNYLPELKNWVDKNKLKNIKYNFLKENVGTVKNLISGIEVSNGKYIKVISPGDYLFNEDSLNRYKQEFHSKDMDVLFSRAVYYSDEGKILKITNPRYKSSSKNKNLKRNICYYCDYLLGASMACKREMIKYFYEINNVVRLLEDYPFSYLTLVNNENVGIINDYLIWYEYGSGVSTSSNNIKLKSDYDSFYKYLEREYSDDKFVKKSLKFIKLLKTNKINKLKACVIRPSYLITKVYNKLYNKLRKFEKVDYNKIHDLTKLK